MSLQSPFEDRLLIDSGEDYSKHTLERYHRTWTKNGRVHRGLKLALQMDEFNERLNGRLQTLVWDEYHCTWDDDYQPAFSDESGAWTIDADQDTRDRLEAFGVMCPFLEDIPLVGTVYRFTLNGRTCRICENDNVVSSRGLDAFPSWTEDMRIARESFAITHICMACHRWLRAKQ